MRLSVDLLRIVRDRLLPDRPVRRRVRGVEMLLPRRHLLPYMATGTSPYARNLVDLAALLRETVDELVVLDVGANVGDSALLIHAEVDCRIVCVEGDPVWLDFLHTNVDGIPTIAVEPSLLAADGPGAYASIVHSDAGTSRIERTDPGSGDAMLPMVDLIGRHPELARVRLVKTDTDGMDVALAPAYARAFTESRPVIFLEYDPRNIQVTSPDSTPSQVWAELHGLGYEHAVVWTNGGHVLGSTEVRRLTDLSAMLDRGVGELGYHFWDVAVAHRDDPDGQRVLAEAARRGVQWHGAGAVR